MSRVRHFMLVRPHHFLVGVIVAALLFPALAPALTVVALTLGGYITGIFVMAYALRHDLELLEGQLKRMVEINRRMCQRAREGRR